MSCGDDTTVNEVKLVVIGDRQAGKTSLARKLFDGQPIAEDDVNKLNIIDWEIVTPDNDSKIKFSVWDFGKSEIDHRTCEFFWVNLDSRGK